MGIIKLLEYLHLGTRVTIVKKKGAFEKKDPLKRTTSLWREGDGPSEDAALALKTSITKVTTKIDLSRLYLLIFFLLHIAAVFFVSWRNLHGDGISVLVNYLYLVWIVVSVCCFKLAAAYFRFRVLDIVYPQLVGAVDGHCGRREMTLHELRLARFVHKLLEFHRSIEGGFAWTWSLADERSMHSRLAKLVGRLCDPQSPDHNPLFANLRVRDRADIVILATQAAFVPSEGQMTATLQRRMDLSKARAGFMAGEMRSF